MDTTQPDAAIDPARFGETQRCFGCGPGNSRGLGLRFYRQGDAVCTEWVPGEGYEGPPGVLHGGLQAFLADEVGAWAVSELTGRVGFTTAMSVRYLRPARIGEPIRATARIRYLLPTRHQAERVLGGALPQAWLPLIPDTDEVPP